MASQILVVEDEESLANLIRIVLSRAGHDVTVVSDGAEAVPVATDMVPDLVVLDVMLPGMDGFQVCRHLREHSLTAQVPIIMLTAMASPAAQRAGFQAGANDYIIKPCDNAELEMRVAAHLGHGPSPAIQERAAGWTQTRIHPAVLVAAAILLAIAMVYLATLLAR